MPAPRVAGSPGTRDRCNDNNQYHEPSNPVPENTSAQTPAEAPPIDVDPTELDELMTELDAVLSEVDDAFSQGDEQ